MAKNPYHPPGTKVRLIPSDLGEDPEAEVEYGIVSWTWWDKKMECWDCFITFFGSKPPTQDRMPHLTYKLRYYAASLTLGWG